MKDDQEKALNDEGGEEAASDTTPVSGKEATGEVPQPETEARPTGEAEVEGRETETEESPKKGYSQRVRELNAKAKEAEARAEQAEAKAQSLVGRLAEITGSIEPRTDFNQSYRPAVEPGAEISPEQYQQDVMRTADSLVTLRINQERTLNRINSEANEALRSYSELDPESDNFNRELSDTVTEAVEAHIRANPYQASVKRFVDKLMKPYQRAVTKEVGKATENLAKQVSETAVRPTAMSKTEKPFEELSIKEMEKKLGVVHP